MKRNILKIIVASGASIALLSGCANQETLSSPNVQTGAAVGAVTGAVIGGNVGDESGTNIALGAVAGALLGGAIGQAVDDQSQEPQETGGWQ